MKRLLLIMSFTIGGAGFAAPPPGANPNSEIYKWFDRQENVVQGSCCGEGDGHILNDDEWRAKGDGYEVEIKDQWFATRPEMALRRSLEDPNPTGHAVVWYTIREREVAIYCFAPGWMN
jgi:hypothetical protein